MARGFSTLAWVRHSTAIREDQCEARTSGRAPSRAEIKNLAAHEPKILTECLIKIEGQFSTARRVALLPAARCWNQITPHKKCYPSLHFSPLLCIWRLRCGMTSPHDEPGPKRRSRRRIWPPEANLLVQQKKSPSPVRRVGGSHRQRRTRMLAVPEQARHPTARVKEA